MGKDSISTTTPLSKDALRLDQQNDTTQITPACTEFLECADGWAARGEWGLSSVWYALAAASEDLRISKQAWLAGFYSAMAVLVDRSLPLSSPEALDTIRASCAIATDGANSQEYVEKDHVEQLKKIDSADSEEELAELNLEEARALLHTKIWRTFRPIVDKVLGKTQSVEEKIEANLIQACYASLRPGKAKTSLLKSFGDAMHLKFGDAIAAPSPRSMKVDKLIESLASLFLEKGAGSDVSGKIADEAGSTIVDLLNKVDIEDVYAALKRRAGEAAEVAKSVRVDAFNAVTAAKHTKVFLPTREAISIEELNEWLTLHKGDEFENTKRLEVIEAVNFFRDQWRASVNHVGRYGKLRPCTLSSGSMNNTDRVRYILTAPSGSSKGLPGKKTLPHLCLRRSVASADRNLPIAKL